MKRKRKKDGTSLGMRTISILLAVFTVLGVVPFTPFRLNVSAASNSSLQDEWTTDSNPFLDALFYLDYRGGNIDNVRDTLYGYSKIGTHTGGLASGVASDRSKAVDYHNTGIGYGTGGGNGVATVTAETNDGDGYHPSTALSSMTGVKPDVKKFRSGGLECGSYVSYVFLNYLPNIAGIEAEGLADVMSGGTKSPNTWLSTLQTLAKRGQATLISSGVATADEVEAAAAKKGAAKLAAVEGFIKNWGDVRICDIILFGMPGSSDLKHVGIYAGKADTKVAGGRGVGVRQMMTHVGGGNGPEIECMGYMVDGGSKKSVPMNIYRLN